MYLFSELYTASFNSIYQTMVPGSLRYRVSVILIKYGLKQLLIPLLSDMIVLPSTRSNFHLEFECSEKMNLNVFQKCLSLPTTVGSRLAKDYLFAFLFI